MIALQETKHRTKYEIELYAKADPITSPGSYVAASNVQRIRG